MNITIVRWILLFVLEINWIAGFINYSNRIELILGEGMRQTGLILASTILVIAVIPFFVWEYINEPK